MCFRSAFRDQRVMMNLMDERNIEKIKSILVKQQENNLI